MSRPAGVTVSAAVLLIGSVLASLAGIFMIFLDRFIPLEALQQDILRSMRLLSGGMFLAGALWGVVTSIGLVRMAKWARISIIAIAVMLLIAFVPSLGIFLAMPLLVPEFESLRAGTAMGSLVTFHVVPIFSGIGWLIYFTRDGVKAAFLEGAMSAKGPSRPLSIAVIAWHAIAFGLGTLAMSFGAWPALILGIPVMGRAAALTNVAMGALAVAIGLGLIRMQPWSHTAAVWFCIYEMAQSLAFAIVPGNAAHFEEMMKQSTPELRTHPVAVPATIYWLVVVIAWYTFGTALWYLFTRKKAFLEAGKSAQVKV